MDSVPFRFIGEAIKVFFDQPQVLEKKPGCPSAFQWRDKTYHIVRLMAEWQDFRRRGKMARNMQPEHAERAASRGSRGVGRYYFRVVSADDRIFELYYDRAPSSVDDQKGNWFLLGERKKL